MTRTREQIHESRRQLRSQYGQLFDSLSALFYRYDPIGINFGDNTDEYDLEAETTLPRLHRCQSEADVLQVVHSEFVRWFDAETAGPQHHYLQIAAEVWKLWQEYLKKSPSH